MRELFIMILVFLVSPVSVCIAADSIKGKVVSVSDGNLISLQDESGEIRQVSLYGIDAPDQEQKMGQHAQKMLSAMVSEKNVEVTVNGVDITGVASGCISFNGLSINAAMVKAGCAWVNPGTCKSSNCSAWKEYQQYARNNKKGLWVDREAEPPWEWRERRLKAETMAKKLNAESEYETYYGSLALSGHHSLWAKRTLPGSSVMAGGGTPGGSNIGTVAQAGSRVGIRSSSGRSSAKSGASPKSPGPRRG